MSEQFATSLYHRVRGQLQETTHAALDPKGRTLCGRFLGGQRETGVDTPRGARDLEDVTCGKCRRGLAWRVRFLDELRWLAGQAAK